MKQLRCKYVRFKYTNGGGCERKNLHESCTSASVGYLREGVFDEENSAVLHIYNPTWGFYSETALIIGGWHRLFQGILVERPAF